MSAPTDLLLHYFQWEVRTWSRAYPLWHRALERHKGPGGHALALGERDGGLSLMLAQHGSTTVCSDLRGPTEKARALHRAMKCEELISYETIDALAIPRPDAVFDVVAFKSMLGALSTPERQAQALLEMHRVMKPGGMLLWAENLAGTRMHQWLRHRFVAWEHYWRYLRLPQDRSLFAPFDRLEVRTTGLLANLGRTERQRDVLGRLDAVLCPLTPPGWHTVGFGVAVKKG
ncbi:MAG TPA: class I SAM-dependent methyltransferase [Flavobacteriales bacterium]|nr:class I SAM-dependent methyltransferase [Flavobacteriales bacterium]HMR26032.1 class I SAM-dependent methyltransferase [Flavobacteriales bacterium]